MLATITLSSCGNSNDLTLLSRSPQEITDEYLENLEGRGKTLLTLNVLNNANVRLYLDNNDNNETAGCSGTTCYFKYDRSADSSILSIKGGSAPNWMGDCVPFNKGNEHRCDLNKAAQLSVTITD